MLRREDYTVGWVCALEVELAAAQEMLDEDHETPQSDARETNIYTCGRVGKHNVVIACLPEGQTGTNSAAAVAVQMGLAFTSIEFGLMVGVGGGVPSEEADIRLGDVVVSKPDKVHGGVVQYDSGKATPSGFERIGILNTPPIILLNAVKILRANQTRGRCTISEYFSKLSRIPAFQRDKTGLDVLFDAAYDHEGGRTCDRCSIDRQEVRESRKSDEEVVVHYGTIASGNQVMKSAAERDRVSADLGGVLCFEMEAAGLMNNFPCLVIRGICDYADSHKNKRWQAYAAGTAAAYAKEMLSVIPPAVVAKSSTAEVAIRESSKRASEFLASTPAKRKKTGNSDSTENGVEEQREDTSPSHHQEHSQTSLSKEQRHNLLDSLRFDQIDARQMNIKAAHAKTCKWLLRKSEYIDWLDPTKLGEHHGFLWIKGKPGTGKSTLMKFALANARKTMKDKTVISFFFNARGEDIEKSTIGTYRSLLLQLLEQLPSLWDIFDLPGLSVQNIINTGHQWSVEPLKALLKQAIQTLGQSSVVCFIDALDECEEQHIRDMVSFFKHVGELAVLSNIRFQVCFSSRHYPHITIPKRLELVLEGQEGHSQDIIDYLESELDIGQSTIAQKVRSELQDKASGIFMWVVLVVDILQEEYDHGQMHALKQRLQEIPNDLYELFHNILIRDSRNKDILVLCIQWVLFAKQPLSPEQLYFAIRSEAKQEKEDEEEEEEEEEVTKWNPEEFTRDDIKRFILDSSKGLAEITISKLQKVQFIHESVKDFLLKGNGLSNIWPELGSNFQGQSHERLKQRCLTYISMDVFTPFRIRKSLPKALLRDAARLRKLVIHMYPFLEYAVQNVLYHADIAEGSGIAQQAFVQSFPLSRWVKLDNLFEKHVVRRHTENVSFLYVLAEHNMPNLIRIDSSVLSCLEVENERYGTPLFAATATGSKEAFQACIEGLGVDMTNNSNSRKLYKHDFEYEHAANATKRNFVYSKKRGIFSHVVELGEERLLTFLIDSGNIEVDLKDPKGRTPLWWASKSGCETVVKLLLDTHKVNVNNKDIEHKTPLYQAALKGSNMVVWMLLDNGAHVNVQGGVYGNALQAASYRGHKQIVKLLLDNSADVNAQGGYYGNALQAASAGGYEQIAKLLLDNSADVNTQGGDYGNALQAASAGGHEEIAKLLLDRGANINAQGGNYSNALQAASVEGHEQIVKLLLDNGADVNAQDEHCGNAQDEHCGIAQDEHNGNALQAASAKGHKQIAKLLLDKGANINTQGGRYGNALQAASYRGHEQVARLLLDRGADINAQGGEYGNALQTALSRGHEQVARLLLDKGADINAQGGHYGSALWVASYLGHEQVARLLLEKGADVNAQGGRYGNALQAASAGGHEQIAKLLLDNSAHVNAQGGHYGNALQAASYRGHEEVARLLLERGANVNAQGGHYDNALQAASYRGYEQVARLLLDKGADVNTQGGKYSNALQAASRAGYCQVARLLLERGADVNAQGGYYGNALQAASAKGYEQIAKLLLDRGADINAQGERYSSALQAASRKGHKEITKLLLGKGAVKAAI